VADLDRRFHLFTEVRPPDLWPEIESREPRAPAPTRRLGTAVIAMVVAVGGIGLAVWAFRAGRPIEPAGPPDEILAFAAPSEQFRWEIVTMGADGTARSVVTGAVPGDAGHPSWSPDGSRIAFEVHVQAGGGPEGGAVDIYVADADGSDAKPLTTDGRSSSPAWSPDGSRIAYVHATPGGNSDIHVMDSEGSTPVRLMTGPAFDLGPAWSPDGSRIAFQSNRDGNPEIYVMNADGTDLTRLTRDPGFDGAPAWSPDGSQIAFASERGGPGIFVMRTDGTEVHRLSREPVVGPLDPAWSPDGSRIAFTSSRNDLHTTALYLLDVATGEATAITEEGDVFGPAWRPRKEKPPETAP
jgi:Tol biopolymer transport system component